MPYLSYHVVGVVSHHPCREFFCFIVTGHCLLDVQTAFLAQDPTYVPSKNTRACSVIVKVFISK
jgi:hypothetical protein